MVILTGSGNDDWEQLREVMSGLGLPGALWLCRGAIRCELLGELEAWDDFDVMAEESDISLRSAVDRAKIEVWPAPGSVDTRLS
jgi:hypothetical protein